jgi:hypothetical protein
MRHSVQQSGRRGALIACRCGTRLSLSKAVVLRFDVKDARAEPVRDAEQQHAQRAAAEAPTMPGALSRTSQADRMP